MIKDVNKDLTCYILSIFLIQQRFNDKVIVNLDWLLLYSLIGIADIICSECQFLSAYPFSYGIPKCTRNSLANSFWVHFLLLHLCIKHYNCQFDPMNKTLNKKIPFPDLLPLIHPTSQFIFRKKMYSQKSLGRFIFL